ncbi:MAG: hypothetical protein GTN76_02585 [Candidatus Aenigmarchaeota archaeon]|nr:hypothetical protein [Candidatus Aenigmarchaeota archaeon]
MNIKASDDQIFTAHNWSGQHAQEGIFIIQGPYIKKSHMISGTKIIDVAPTIMYLMGLDIPREMEGKVLINSIDEDYLRSTPITFTESPYDNSPSEALPEVYSKEDTDIVRKRLKDLGYID